MAEHADTKEMRQVKSCGFLVMKPDQSFLIMEHSDRYDLPKGHMELGETEQQTGLRGKSMNRLQDNINIRSLNPT
jgi:hypothetical protein